MGCWLVFVCTDSCTGTVGTFGGASWAGKDSPVCSIEFVKWAYITCTDTTISYMSTDTNSVTTLWDDTNNM